MAHPLTRSYCEGGEGQVDTSEKPRISARSPVLPMIFTLEIVPSAPFVPRIFVYPSISFPRRPDYRSHRAGSVFFTSCRHFACPCDGVIPLIIAVKICWFGINCRWVGSGCELFSLVVDCRSLVGGMIVALALSLRAVERCDDARRAGAVVMARRISVVRRPWRLG